MFYEQSEDFMGKIYNSITEMVGHTPLLRLNRLVKKFKLKSELLGKCEAYNPFFSIKDRVALKMIEDAEKKGLINDSTVFLEATSGNTGIALAALCAAKGYKLVITMPENMSSERIKLMKHFGAEVILTPKEDGMNGSIKKAELLAEKNPNVIMLKQFENQANPDAHKLSTSVEILEDTGGNVDVLVASVGTAGTLMGIASTLKTCNPDLYVVAVEPEKSPVLSGGQAGNHKILGIGAGFIPPFYDEKLVDEVVQIQDDEALNMTKEAALEEGLPIGISAGAALAASIKIAKKSEFFGKTIVVILPDSVERYLSLDWF